MATVNGVEGSKGAMARGATATVDKVGATAARAVVDMGARAQATLDTALSRPLRPDTSLRPQARTKATGLLSTLLITSRPARTRTPPTEDTRPMSRCTPSTTQPRDTKPAPELLVRLAPALHHRDPQRLPHRPRRLRRRRRHHLLRDLRPATAVSKDIIRYSRGHTQELVGSEH